MFKIFSRLEIVAEKLELVFRSAVDDKASTERRHRDEIQRMENAHVRELEARNKQIEDLKELNERLLRLAGVDSLDRFKWQDEEAKVVAKNEKEKEEAQPLSSGAAIIKRDQEKTREIEKLEAYKQLVYENMQRGYSNDPQFDNKDE